MQFCKYCEKHYKDCQCLACPCCGQLIEKENVCECGNCKDCCICEEKETEQKYNVLRPEIYYALLEVKAKSPEEALQLAKAGESAKVHMTDYLEFCNFRDNGWQVEDNEGNLLLDE